MRIRTQLVLMATAVLVPIVLAAGIALEKIREGEREAALRGLHETVRATALIVDREVQGSLSALKALGNSPNLERRDFKAFYAEAAALNRLPDVWTLLLDQSGAQVLNTVVPYGTPAPPPGALQRVTRVIATQQPLITDLSRGPVSGKMLTTIYVPAAAAGGHSFVVAQAFSIDHWTRTALQARLPSDWVVAVIDRQGKFIARSHRPADLLGQAARPELVAAAAVSNSGLIRHDILEGVESYDAFTHSSLTGWTIAVAAPVKSVEGAADRARKMALLGMLLAVVASLGTAAAFGQRFILAIEGSGRAAVALGRGEQPAVVRTTIEEVNELNQALVDAGKLLAFERQSREAAEAERERLLHNETLARETAQAQNIAKDQFLAMLGHELRNPLAAIAGATTLLERSGPDAERTERCVEIIRRQNRHLVHIVNDLLDVSRLMAGKIELEMLPMNLAEAVSNCVEALRTTERAAGYRMTVAATGPVWVCGDAVRIEQILNNLLTNALKFSPAGGEIRIEVRQEAGMAVVTVSDAGAGMSPDLLLRVFEPFVQGPPPANRTQSGMGIGLALVRQLVQLHGGEVHAASAGPGHGSEFSFCLPAIAAQQAASPERLIATPASRKLVYVEDNVDARVTTGELLREFGYEVHEVGEGARVLPAVLNVQPDAVLMDIGLPDMNGYEVASRLRAHPATRAVPLVALTGYGQARDKEVAAAAGFDAHLVKPVDPQQIVEILEKLLAPRGNASPASGQGDR